MKPLFILITIFSTLLSTTGFANDPISQRAVKAFEQNFAEAKEVNWTTSPNLLKVQFVLNEQTLTAFYSIDGEFLGVTRNISSFQLPLMLQAAVKKEYSNYWITELFELSGKNGTEYYITLEDADHKLTLKSQDSVYWSTYQKLRK
ncbi:MAG TPA: hypothetical protein VEY32_02210 [Flavisolibacter sp.]|nr:hypothetical protein [Chitinophagaceae bacterium]HZG99861.1 hypothetical protein [Flavisolibacter sp.]